MPPCPSILVVEDHENYHNLYRMTLEDAFECKIDFATTGQGAIAQIEANHYDLVLLDLNLPDIPGRDVLLYCRQDHRDTHLSVIILTGDSASDIQTELLNLGADDFIEKGSAPEILTARVGVQLRHKLSVDRATELAMEVDAFTAGVLHDIKNIENNVMSLCYLIKMLVEEDPEKNKAEILENLERLNQKAGSLGTYASDILDKVRKNQSEPEIAEVRIAEVVEQIKRLLGRSNEQAQSFQLTIPEHMEPVFADYHFLKMAIFNIIQNSIKYAREDVSPIINITQEKFADHFVLKFRDNGIGIPDSELHKVFEAFVRGSKTSATSVAGLGLGLSMVSRAMGKMHGSVWAERPTDGGPGVVMCLKMPLVDKGQREKPSS